MIHVIIYRPTAHCLSLLRHCLYKKFITIKKDCLIESDWPTNADVQTPDKVLRTASMLVSATKGVFSIMTHTHGCTGWRLYQSTLWWLVKKVIIVLLGICIEVQIYTAVKECLYWLPQCVPKTLLTLLPVPPTSTFFQTKIKSKSNLHKFGDTPSNIFWDLSYIGPCLDHLHWAETLIREMSHHTQHILEYPYLVLLFGPLSRGIWSQHHFKNNTLSLLVAQRKDNKD